MCYIKTLIMLLLLNVVADKPLHTTQDIQGNPQECSVQIAIEAKLTECLICLNPIISEEKCTLLCQSTNENNRHIFHLDCINKWWKTKNLNCPACRSENVLYLMPDERIIKPSFVKKIVSHIKKINSSDILSGIAATGFLATCAYIYYTNAIFYDQEPSSILEPPIFCPSECLDRIFDALQKNHPR